MIPPYSVILLFRVFEALSIIFANTKLWYSIYFMSAVVFVTFDFSQFQPIGFLEYSVAYQDISDAHIMARWDTGQYFCFRVAIPDGSILFKVCFIMHVCLCDGRLLRRQLSFRLFFIFLPSHLRAYLFLCLRSPAFLPVA